MIVGELRHGQLIIIDRIRETVRLSEGLDGGGSLNEAAKIRALDCLAQLIACSTVVVITFSSNRPSIQG